MLASLEEVEILKKSVDWPYALGDVGVSLESHPEFGWFPNPKYGVPNPKYGEILKKSVDWPYVLYPRMTSPPHMAHMYPPPHMDTSSS